MTRFAIVTPIAIITLLSAGVVWLTDTRGVSDVMDLSNATPQGPGLERYADPVRGFYFDYPAGLSITETDVDEDRLIFGDTEDGDARFLITAYPYVLDEPLTEEIIEARPFANDMTSPLDRVILPSGATAFLFQRADTPFGTTRDALFLHNGTVYNVNAVADSEDLFNQILQSWRFVQPTTL